MNKIKVGDLVEDCSLMTGVVMKVEGDDIQVRRLDLENADNYPFKLPSGESSFSQCSLRHCGIVLITPEQVKERLILGKDKLAEIWGEVGQMDIDDIYPTYPNRVTEEYNKFLKS